MYEAEMIRIDAQIKAIGELIESLREKSYD